VIILMPHREIETINQLMLKGYTIDVLNLRKHRLLEAKPRIPVLTDAVRLDQSMVIKEKWDARRG
jgi:hypothetical protein